MPVLNRTRGRLRIFSYNCPSKSACYNSQNFMIMTIRIRKKIGMGHFIIVTATYSYQLHLPAVAKSQVKLNALIFTRKLKLSCDYTIYVSDKLPFTYNSQLKKAKFCVPD